MLVAIEKTVVEGAGAAGLAAMLGDPRALRGQEGRHRSCAAAISTRICSPMCWSATSSAAAASRGFAIAAQDRPGALAAITAKFHEAGVNIIEINHSRIFTRLPAKDTVIEVECEARDAEAIDDVVEAAGSRRIPRRARVPGLSRVNVAESSLPGQGQR